MAASSMPIPQAPRTPSPLSDEDAPPAGTGLGVEGVAVEHDRSTLSPTPSFYFVRNDSRSSFSMSTPYGLSPHASTTSLPLTEEEDPNETLTGEGGKNPFQFQPQTYVAGRPAAKSIMGQRRGHKYKHSSVSHQIFLEPPPRAPLRLPASLPIPDLKEGWKSMTPEQKTRLSWCFCHLFIAAYVQWSAHGSLAMTALSHLIFYDAIGAFLCAGVEVLSNFEVWKRSSIRHPFGLERSEVLVGFAMSILLLFMGFDLISHNVGHMLEDVGDHEAHHEHHHERVTAGSVDLVALLAICSTLVSALMLKNHSRIARAMRFGSISFLPSVLSNPQHLLTISCSSCLIILPFMSTDMYYLLDRMLSTAMALFMCLLGVQLVKTLGSMLLMSYSGDNVPEVMRDIESDSLVTAVEEAKFWQVHYGLCMANLKLRVRGTEEAQAKLRERIASLIRNKLGGDSGEQTWEVSTHLILEKD